MITRRTFLASTAALAAAPYAQVAGSDVLRVGLIGCGGRGTGAAENILRAAEGIELVAMADLFPDRIERSRQYLGDPANGVPNVRVTDETCFTGFDAHRRLLDSGVDVVLLATPPGFRPFHFEAAVEAGKHVFLEKPVAVDPPGVRRVIAAGDRARERGLAVVAGTQRRHQRAYIETVRRIHDGAIGEILAGRCSWNTGRLWHYDRNGDDSDVEHQIRNWLYFDWLSGDHIVEQHVHNLDVMNWVLRAHPVAATAMGGRTQRTEERYGNIYDHFAVELEYPGGIRVTSMCRQWEGASSTVGESVVGTAGRADPAGAIEGSEAWRAEGGGGDPYEQEQRDLVESIRAGEPLNEARTVAEATMTAILGREAAYTGQTLAWDDLLASDLTLGPPTYEFGPLAARAVPIPGNAR